MAAQDKGGISLPLGWDTLLTILGGIALAVWGYASFVGKMVDLEEKMEEANIKIEELVEKHIADENVRYIEMEEQIKWYQKEFNLNPLSWRKKKGKK